MTPKDKAENLVYKFYWRETHLTCSITDAKQCALISVDEIMELMEKSYYDENIIKGAKLYWNEVKQEIKKL
jgi:hypothetical protein